MICILGQKEKRSRGSGEMPWNLNSTLSLSPVVYIYVALGGYESFRNTSHYMTYGARGGNGRRSERPQIYREEGERANRSAGVVYASIHLETENDPRLHCLGIVLR